MCVHGLDGRFIRHLHRNKQSIPPTTTTKKRIVLYKQLRQRMDVLSFTISFSKNQPIQIAPIHEPDRSQSIFATQQQPTFNKKSTNEEVQSPQKEEEVASSSVSLSSLKKLSQD